MLFHCSSFPTDYSIIIPNFDGLLTVHLSRFLVINLSAPELFLKFYHTLYIKCEQYRNQIR